MATELVHTLHSMVTVAGRDYSLDIVVEISAYEPFTITVSAHHHGMTVMVMYEAKRGDIRHLYKRDDCLRIVRENNMIPQATDDLAVLISRGKLLH